VPPDDFFDEDWEEPSRTQDTAITRPAGDGEEAAHVSAPEPSQEGAPPPPPRAPRPPQRRPAKRGGSRVPKMPKMPKMLAGGASLPPLEYRRLAALGAGILVIILVLVILARGCSGSSTKSSNEAYVSTLTTTVLNPSDDVAARFRKMLDLPRASLGILQKRLSGQLSSMRTVQAHAQALKPTKQLAPYQGALLQALQFRVTGLECMSQRIATAWKLKTPAAAGQQLYPCTGQLLASDYVYADSFATSADAALKQVGATGVPTSVFVPPSELSWVTPIGIGQQLRALHPGPVHGVHGTEMGSVVASPQTLTLQPGTPNFVKGNKDLVFVVSIKNSGKSTEVDVPVKLTLKRVSGGGTPIVQTEHIPSVAAGQTQTVRFSGLFASAQSAPDYSVPYKLTVTSLKVPGEQNLTNNTASYTVEFSIS
jgi:CARDB